MNESNRPSKTVTVLTAAKITELTTKFPGLGEDTFVHERDYNQAENGRVARADQIEAMASVGIRQEREIERLLAINMALINANKSLADMAVEMQSSRVETSALPPGGYDLVAHIERQRAFSERTFGPGMRTAGVSDHIRKELNEIAADPLDLEEWIDVVMLALDGAWRTGVTSRAVAETLYRKLAKNESRKWPDWRTAPLDKAIEHDRSPVEPSEPRMPLEHYRTENGKLRKAMADLMHKCPRCRAEAKEALSAMTRKAHHPRCELMQPHGHEPPKCTCPSENGE